MEETISLRQMLLVLKRRLKLIFLIIVFFVASSWAFTEYLISPTYETSTLLLVKANQPGETYSSKEQLINTYNVIITSPLVLQSVIDKLSLNLTHNSLRKNVHVKSEGQSQVFAITVKEKDPELAVLIADTTAEVFQNELAELLNYSNVSIFSKAELPLSPISPNGSVNMTLAFVAGVLFSIGSSLFIELMNNKLRTDEDVEKSLDLPVLGTIATIQLKKEARAQKLSKKTKAKEFIDGGETIGT